MITPGIGQIFKSSVTGKVYEVRKIFDRMVILESLDAFNQVLTGKENLNVFYEKVPKV